MASSTASPQRNLSFPSVGHQPGTLSFKEDQQTRVFDALLRDNTSGKIASMESMDFVLREADR